MAKVIKKSNTKKKVLIKKGVGPWVKLLGLLLFVAVGVGVMSFFFPCSKEKVVRVVGSKDRAIRAQFKLEIADNDKTRMTGLMGRKSLKENGGMLFVFDKPDYYSMWMKNTFVPLDMLFVNNDKVIISVAEDRVPHNEEFITPCNILYEKQIEILGTKDGIDMDDFFENCEQTFLKPVNLIKYVVELPAGAVRKNSINIGDKIAIE